MDYKEFLENKIVIAESHGYEIKKHYGDLLPHAKAITEWCIKGGRRAIFASFGLTKTAMQLELAYQIIAKTKYYDDGLFYLKSIEYKINVPTLFDFA